MARHMYPVNKKGILHNILINREECKIEKILNKKKIKHRFLKGLFLLKQLIPDYLMFKRVGDIDLLVARNYIWKTIHALSMIGYCQLFCPGREEEEIRMIHPIHGTVVELHTNAFNFSRSYYIDEAFSLIGKQETKKLTHLILSDTKARRKELTLLYLLLHFGLNHCFRGEDRLRSIILYISSFNEEDWKKTAKLLKLYKLQIYLNIFIQMEKYYFKYNNITYAPHKTYCRPFGIWEKIYFYIFPENKLFKTVDVIKPGNKKEERRFYFILNVIKIICSEQTVHQKMWNCIRIMIPNPLRFYKYLYWDYEGR